MNAALGDHAPPQLNGTWNVVIKTPLGTQQVAYEFRREGEALRGLARQGDDVTELQDPQLNGTRLTWTQQVTRPLKLRLFFDVTVDGDTLAGTAKAGALPASQVSGARSAD